MRKFGSLMLAFGLVCLMNASSFAHVGVVVFYPQVPDPAAITIDGNDDDWGWYDPALALNQPEPTKSEPKKPKKSESENESDFESENESESEKTKKSESEKKIGLRFFFEKKISDSDFFSRKKTKVKKNCVEKIFFF